MIGIPPATAASNATITPCRCADSKISLPCIAMSALFAVTHMLATLDGLEHEPAGGGRSRR